MTKTYDELREQMELNEISLGRAGSAIFFATQVRQNGERLEQAIGKAKGEFNKSKSAKTIDDKLNIMVDGMTEMSNALYLQRKMMGSITGVALSAALTTQRTDKQMLKLMKGKSKR